MCLGVVKVLFVTILSKLSTVNSFSDPVGDHNGFPDVREINAQVFNGNLEVMVELSTNIVTSFKGFVALDLDKNPATEAPNLKIPGIEALVAINVELYSSNLEVLTADKQQFLFNNIQTNGKFLIYAVPLALLGNVVDVDIFWMFAQRFDSDFDRVPDTGVFNLGTGEVIMRELPPNEIHIDIQDDIVGASEPTFPNMSRLAHSVDPVFNFPGMWVWISVDSDKSLCTGFENDGGRPPSFGIDYEIQIDINPDISSTRKMAYLYTDNEGIAKKKFVGMPDTDIFLQVAGNQIICRVPLRYLRSFDLGGAIIVRSLDHDYLAIPGGLHDDRMPEVGGWDLLEDSAVPSQACEQDIFVAPVEISDPIDALGGNGLDNDEFIGLLTCPGNEAFLFEISYLHYSGSGAAITKIFMDTDRNKATGETIQNYWGTTSIGADYFVETRWNPFKLYQETLMHGPEKGYWANQLVNMDFAQNHVYITLPLDCVGNPSTDVDLLLMTISDSTPMQMTVDVMPNDGVITVENAGRSSCTGAGGSCSGQDQSQQCCNHYRCIGRNMQAMQRGWTNVQTCQRLLRELRLPEKERRQAWEVL